MLTGRDWIIRPLAAADSRDELTELIHAAYAPYLAAGLRFVGTHQTVAMTADRLADGARRQSGFVSCAFQ